MPGRRRDVVRHRFGDPVENEPDAHAGGKQHREPGAQRMLGPVGFVAQAEVSVAACGQEEHERNESQHDPQVEPAEVAGDETQARAEDGGKRRRRHEPPDDDEDDACRENKLHCPHPFSAQGHVGCEPEQPAKATFRCFGVATLPDLRMACSTVAANETDWRSSLGRSSRPRGRRADPRKARTLPVSGKRTKVPPLEGEAASLASAFPRRPRSCSSSSGSRSSCF